MAAWLCGRTLNSNDEVDKGRKTSWNHGRSGTCCPECCKGFLSPWTMPIRPFKWYERLRRCWTWNRRAVQLLGTLVSSFLWSTLITWEKLGLNDRREQKVQLGHVPGKCDCAFLSRVAFLGYLLISGSVAMQLTLSVLPLNMWELHLSTPSNACVLYLQPYSKQKWDGAG